jgi:Bacterial trigger factor protein (TF) C-terminus
LRDKTLAGKRAIFDVEVLDASNRIIPEVTDEFAAQVRPGLTKESLLAELQKAVDQEDAKEFTPARNLALGKALVQVLDVVVPDTLVTNQAREKFATMMADMRDGGVSDDEIKKQINPDNFLKYKDIVQDDIIADFKVSMATDEIARLEGITVPAYQVDEQMEVIRKDAADSKEEFDEALIRGKVETTLTRQAVYDWLAEKADLTVEYLEQEPVFDEKLMEKLAAESLQREQQGTSAVMEASSVIDATVESSSSTETAPMQEEVSEPAPAITAKDVAPVVEAVAEPKVEEPVPVVVEAVAEPKAEEPTPVMVEAVAEPKVEEPTPAVKPETEPAPAAAAAAVVVVDEASMTMEERAFSALLNAGLISINKNPDDPDFDHSKDSEIADGTIFVDE